MSKKRINPDLRRLIDAAVSGSLSDEELRRLDAALCSDDDVLAAYLDYCQLEVDLFFRSRAQVAGQRILSQIDLNQLEPQQPRAVSSEGSTAHRFRFANTRWLTAFTAAAVLFVAAACALSWVGGWRIGRAALQESLANAPSANATPAAYLTMNNGCTWDDGTRALAAHRVGAAIQAGNELKFYEGIAAFQLSSGVLLSVEGPASLVITSPTSLMLQYGKLTANVPSRVQDFQLLAGSCHLTARDAEIGVVVTGGQLEVHAFTGEAKLSLSPFSGVLHDTAELADDDIDPEAGRFVVVETGRATTLLASGDVRQNMPANRNQFAAKLSMNGRLPAAKAYVDAVLSSRPVSYWRFESIDGGQVLNEVQGAQPLKVVDNVALSGDARNYSLDLDGTTSGGHLVSDIPVPLSGTDYSVEIWCKPSHFHRGTMVAMGFEDQQKPVREILHHAFILQTQRSDDKYAKTLLNSVPGSIRFLHRNPPTRDPTTGTSCYSSKRYQLRRWQHVVAVKEKDVMRLYINGALASNAKDSTEIVQGLRLMIGETSFRRPELGPSRPFRGQLDELAIYNRALDNEEIVKHYRAINFASPETRAESDVMRKTASKRHVGPESGNSAMYATAASIRG